MILYHRPKKLFSSLNRNFYSAIREETEFEHGTNKIINLIDIKNLEHRNPALEIFIVNVKIVNLYPGNNIIDLQRLCLLVPKIPVPLKMRSELS